MTKAKNIYANTAAALEEVKLFDVLQLKQIASLNFDEAIKRLYALNYFGDSPIDMIDVDMLIDGAIYTLVDFIHDYSPSNDLTNFLLSYTNFDNNDNDDDNRFKTRLELTKSLHKSFGEFIKIDMELRNLLTEYRAGNIIDFGNHADATALLKDKKYTEFLLLKHKLAFDALKKHKQNYFKNGPFVDYFFHKLFEIKNVRFILICLKNNIEPDLNLLWRLDDE